MGKATLIDAHLVDVSIARLQSEATNSMWTKIDVEIVRKVDTAAIGSFENADTEDGILLNHDYVDMRGFSIADAQEIVAEELELLGQIEALDGHGDRLHELLDELLEGGSELAGLDIGTAGAVFALSAAGAAPISSCNGGLLGEARHSSGVPHILFSITEERLGPILAAAEATDVGLLNNSGHIEVFADQIPKLNAFSRRLLAELER